MKFFLLQLTAAALVVAGTHAQEQPLAVPSGSDADATVALKTPLSDGKLTTAALLVAGTHAQEQPLAVLSGSEAESTAAQSVSDGVREGRRQIQRIWRNGGRDCDRAFSLRNDARRIRRRYADNQRNSWRENAFNQGVRRGVDQEVQRIERECFENNSSTCTDLGESAAQSVVLNNWCGGSRAGAKGTTKTNYRRECLTAATSICEGQIPSAARRFCSNRTLRTSNLRNLQGMCRSQIRRMIRNSGGSGPRQTRRPTRRPTRRRPRGAPRGAPKTQNLEIEE